MGDARVKTRRVHTGEITLRWTFTPIAERIYENEWAGLSMQIEIASPGFPIHWVIEDTTESVKPT